MNDPTNWNIDPSIKSIEVEDPAMAKEMEKRWNAYPKLIEALREAEIGAPGYRLEIRHILRELGESA